MTQSVSENKGWRVTFAGTGINLALGVLYTWSVIKAAIQTNGHGLPLRNPIRMRWPALSLPLP